MGAMRKSLTSPGQVGEVMRDVRRSVIYKAALPILNSEILTSFLDISHRTYPTHPFFQQGMPGQDMLSRILLACLQASPVVGYCQVMSMGIC
jgi:hypothetical protein